ncbi:hypothetical protein MMC06_006716, partial [Schaereria dolodes]|nr:hypothetical protein [Schaereria dolodes]
MPRQRKSKPQLGDSWVVESDSEEQNDDTSGTASRYAVDAVSNNPRSSDNILSDATTSGAVEAKRRSVPQDTPRKRSTRTSTRSSTAEPELIMPSIQKENLNGSRMMAERRSQAEGQKRLDNSNRKIFAAQEESETASQQAGDLSRAILGWTFSILGWIFDMIGLALYFAKTPIALMVAGWLLFGMAVMLRNLLTSSIYSALSPICRLPGASLLQLEMCNIPAFVNYKGEQTPVQFDELMNAQSKFEEVLEQSAAGITLPLDMKRGEASIRDLRQVVRFSQLRSKNELVLEFDGFVETAKLASFDLQKFNSHIGRSVDNILSTARWTQRVLDDITLKSDERGALTAFITDEVLALFQPVQFTENKLLNQYIQHMRVVEEEIHRLIEEAQALLMLLQNLEDRLDVIHGITVRDDLHAQGDKDEILSQLWTMLGGNRSKLGKYDAQIKLLQQVNTYRKTAFGHVSGTILKLQAMGSELEGLRERVGSAELLRDQANIPLSVHIENIRLGVERLELGREKAKVMESDYLRKRLGRSEVDQRLIDR